VRTQNETSAYTRRLWDVSLQMPGLRNYQDD
jgi:hypothetical protein